MKGTERQSIKKIEGFVCFVFLEILEVTSLSTRLLRQTLKTSFKAKKWGPLVFGEGFYINLSLANPIRFPNRIPGDLTVSNSRRKIYTNWIWLFSRAHSIGSIYLNKILTHKLGIKVGDWGGGHQWTSSLGNKSHPDWYLKIYQDEANLAVKEKAEKWKGVTPRPAKAEIMPGAIHNKDSESSYKGVCCLLMGNTCFFVQETHFWSSECILGTETRWQKKLYGSFQMDHRVSHCKLKGVQCEAESQTTTHILITSTPCLSILLYADLNVVKSSGLVKAVSNLVGCSADTVQTQPRSTVRGHLCLPAEEGSEAELDTKCLFNLENTSKSHLQGDVKYTVRWETKPIYMFHVV